MTRYAPWIAAVAFAVVIVLVRLLTNRMVQTLRPVSPWISGLYIVGFLGLTGTFFWSIFAIAWWACLPVLAAYGLTCLVPSAVQNAMRDPTVSHLAAIRQATHELSHMPAGDTKQREVIKRADEIMRSRGWVPK